MTDYYVKTRGLMVQGPYTLGNARARAKEIDEKTKILATTGEVYE